MKCKHVQQKMLDYTEHQLDGRVHQKIARHLQVCRECSQELEAIQHTLSLLSSSSTYQEPSESYWNDFTMDVMRKVRAANSPKQPHIWSSAWQIRLAMASALLLLAIAGIFTYRALRSQTPAMITSIDNSVNEQTASPSVDSALQQIVPEELPQNMLETEFALFDDMGSPDLEIHSSDITLERLLSGLSDEEKQALLLELYKMRESSQ